VLPAEPIRSYLAIVAETSTDLVGIADPSGRALYLNPAGRTLVGMPLDEPVGGRDLGAFHPPWAHRRIRDEGIPRAMAEGSWTGETALLGADGREILVWQLVLAHRGPDGIVEFISTVARDLSTWKGTEFNLRERVKELRALYGATRALARWDHALEERLDELVHTLPGGFLYPEITTARVRWGSRTFTCGRFQETPWMLTSTIEGKGDAVGSIDLALLEERPVPPGGDGPFLPEERELLSAVAIAIGETLERERIQTEFMQVQKMQTIGRLAGGIAHDFNNLLTVVLGHMEAALDMAPAGAGELREELDHIGTAARRGASLTNQLLAFSRKQLLQERVVDLGTELVRVEPMLRRLTPSRIDLSIDAGAHPVPVRLDPAKLDQVLLNLVVNAVDAIDGAGRIEIRIESRALAEREALALPWKAAAGSFVVLVVRDSGAGMSDEVRDRIFEPFFTTKPEGEGTGLGLSMVFGFVKQSRGHIFVDSTPGEGSAFHLLFPELPGLEMQSAPAAGGATPDPDADVHPPAEHAAEGNPRGGATILLVEDEDAVRSVLRQVLERGGHRVIEAGDGEEALRIAAREGQRIDVVLTDVIMPLMGGATLLRSLREAHPELPVILMSGYSRREVTHEVLSLARHFLRKPFSRRELDQVLAEALAARPGTG
jgi:signal transduction histidine kinase/CheY-like chemotaxis protein